MAEAAAQSNRTLQIRKYPNRRYYDSTRSKHVTLEEIHGLIRDGYDIHVTDSRHGEDITGKVLAQIIIELDPPKLGVFPPSLLHKLLRSSEQLVTDFVQKYFNDALNSFLDAQRNMEQVMRSALGLPSSTPTLADWTKAFWSPLKNTPWAGAEAPPPAAGAGPAADPEAENLRARVQQLQEENARLRRGRTKRTPGRRKG